MTVGRLAALRTSIRIDCSRREKPAEVTESIAPLVRVDTTRLARRL
jgi:hypothetical protein